MSVCEPTRPPSAPDIALHFAAGLARAERVDMPFRHFYAEGLLPAAAVDDLARLPVVPPRLDGLSGRREYHNAARFFCNAKTMQRFPALAALARALQARAAVAAIETFCETSLAGTFLRVEYAADSDGFWLEPHTDLGVKKFTCLISLAEDERQSSLGTDIYTPDRKLYRRYPFHRGAALVFIPAHDTWHGFEKRPIVGCRRSLIVNFVGPEWRDRAQLAFPDDPVQGCNRAR
jgi:hypothetical protein